MKRNLLNRMGRGRFVFIPVMAAAFLALISFVVMQLWNNLLPDIIHVRTVNFCQAMGIFILCKILFGFGRMGRGGGFGHKREMFKNRLAERVKDMSPEDRARFEERFKEHRFNPCRNFWQDEKKEDHDINL